MQDADKELCTGMAWRRLLSEANVALMLARTTTASRGAASSHSGRLSRTAAMGLECDSLLSCASEPLRLQLRYIVARVEWALLQQADDVLACMCEPRKSQVAEAHELTGCPEGLETCPVLRELLHLAFRDSAALAAEKLFSTLECILAAACHSPELLLRPRTLSEPSSEVSSSRRRVMLEMARRGLCGAGSGQEDTHTGAQSGLERAQKCLKEQLALEVLLFSQAAFVEFSGKCLKGEVCAMGLTRRQREAVEEKHLALRRTAFSAEHAHAACRRLVRQLQSTRATSA